MDFLGLAFRFRILAVLVLGAARVWLFPMPMVLSITADVGGGDGGSRMLVCHSHGSRNSDCRNDDAGRYGTAPALALLMTLPAVSLPSLIMLRKAFPAKALWLTGAMVAVSGVIVGGLALLFLI